MNGKLMLYRDQYGNTYPARTRAALRERVGGGRVSKMYVDRHGATVWIGYVIGALWLEAFVPFEGN